ncbi:hypothetical protein [Nitrobacter sp.]|uniref:hypothetical protein n=1 Tax=Nitrobacter sp. TaxID=29420 RepID=UPI003F653557
MPLDNGCGGTENAIERWSAPAAGADEDAGCATAGDRVSSKAASDVDPSKATSLVVPPLETLRPTIAPAPVNKQASA